MILFAADFSIICSDFVSGNSPPFITLAFAGATIGVLSTLAYHYRDIMYKPLIKGFLAYAFFIFAFMYVAAVLEIYSNNSPYGSIVVGAWSIPISSTCDSM
jgi:ascorbate-specific PTS system EIIC-type component UlaA